MAQPPKINRIRIEDFAPEDRALASKLASNVNGFMDETIRLFNKNIDFENLNRQVVKVTVQIDNSGNIVNTPQAKYTLRNGRLQGITVISALNVDSPTTYPTTAPFVSFTFSDGLLTIVNVTGLQNNSNYNLTLELIG